MTDSYQFIIIPYSPQTFPKKYFKKSFALNKWPQVPILKWTFMLPFLLFFIVALIPAILVMLYYALKNKDYDDFLNVKFMNFMKFFADFGHAESSEWEIERKYRKQDHTSKVLKIVYLPKNKIALFEKISVEKFNKIADEVWVCENENEIYDKIVLQNFEKSNSILVHDTSDENICSFEYLNKDNEKLNQSLEKRKKITFKDFQKYKTRHPKITLQPNNILPPQIVYYYEPNYSEEVNNTIQNKLTQIDQELAKKGYKLMYLPRIVSHAKQLDIEKMAQYANYENPNIETQVFQNSIQNIVNNTAYLDITDFKNALELSVGMPKLETPCFIRCVEDGYLPEFKKYSYSVFPLIDEEEESLIQKIDFYLDVVGKRDEPQYRMVVPDPNDPDEQFNSLGNKINPELKDAIDKIKQLNDDKLLISSMVYIMDSLKDKHPGLCTRINETLYQSFNKESAKISRLIVDNQWRIFLPDFNNLEIEMGPLPKTIFIFLLRHPEGVMFKQMREHIDELTKIYTSIGNRASMENIKKSMLELTDPRSNSINEKCSRIKEAFIAKMDDHVACNYYVTGDRSSNKGIKIDRSLVEIIGRK